MALGEYRTNPRTAFLIAEDYSTEKMVAVEGQSDSGAWRLFPKRQGANILYTDCDKCGVT